MAHSRQRVDEQFLTRVGGVILLCTAVLTLSFFGAIALGTGETAGLEKRIPLYVLGMAVTFVAGVVGLDQWQRDGLTIIASATALAVLAFVTLLLGGEGLIYAVRNPQRAVESRQFIYLLAAGLIATGLGYWGLNHWRAVRSSL